MSKKLDCPKCGEQMAWKYLRDPLCPRCDAREIEKACLAVNGSPSLMQKDFNEAIDFAIATDEPQAFLKAWREGDWPLLKKEWPEFKLPSIAGDER
jgi:hypothetical protein